MPLRKRSNRSSLSQAGAPAGKRVLLSWNRSSFGRMMETIGVGLGGDQHTTLPIEPAMLQKKLSASFSYDRPAVTEFCEGLSDYCADMKRFRVALSPAKAADGAHITVRVCGLDSLIRILLGVDCLQSSVVILLLDKLSASTMVGQSSRDEQELSTLILHQLQMLDHLVQGKEFCSKLMEVVGAASPEVQREIVTALPHIVDDPQHGEAAILLKSMLTDSPLLTAPIMDALSNLIIDGDIAAEILDVAMERLQTSNLTDLPAIIKFIMQHVTAKNAQEIIGEFRSKLCLDLSPLHANVVTSTPLYATKGTKKVSAELSAHFVVFDSIASITRLLKPVADGWLKAIEAVSEPSDHRVIDILVLFFLHSIRGRRKSVETLLTNKIRAGAFSDDLISETLGSHAKALTEYFSSILVLCDNLMCSAAPTVSSFAASLYKHLFAALDIPYQQAVVGALIMHINNGGSGEVDRALSLLLDLVHTHFTTMQRFAVLIKGVLDRLEYLSTAQIRQLYQVLTVLGFSDPDKGSAIEDELRILIRKQLLHTEQSYRHMGIIGAVTSVKQLTSEGNALSSQSSLTASRKQMARSLLDLVMELCSVSVDSMILFCEEMAAVAPALETHTLTSLSEQVTSSFQDDYLVDASDPLPTGASLIHALDTVDEGCIALNILPLVGGEGAEGVRSMAARFHLLKVCEASVNGNLEGIDALLGCPVVLLPEDQLTTERLEGLSLDKCQEICLSLFHTINWYRELVCAFSSEADPDMRGKVLLRLTGITELTEALDRAMAATPGWIPPIVNSWVPTTKHKKKASEVSLASLTAATVNVDKEVTVSTTDKSAGVGRVKGFFRELDLGVFKSLGFGVLSRTFLDSEFHTRSKDELKIRPPQLAFLLEDLQSKTSGAFTVFGSKGKSGHFSGQDLSKTMATILPSLCGHLESTCEFFQTQMDDNDGIVDMCCSHGDYPHHCLCLHLLLKSLATFLAWPTLLDRGYSELLSSCMETLATRRQATPTGPTLPQLATDACKYLEGFVGVLPTLTCAHSLGKLLVTLTKVCKANHLQITIGEVCGRLLRRAWHVSEATPLKKEALEYLLKYHLEWAREPLVVIEHISGEAVIELIGDNAIEEATKYPTLTKASYSWYYRVMMSSLVHQIKSLPPPKKGHPPSPEELEERLHVLEVAARVLFILVNQVKSFCKSAVLSSCLKNGRLFVDAFLRSGMQVLDGLFKNRKDDVLTLLKSLQGSTRILQNYCGHSKVARDTNLINNVPQLKKTLEQFLFKVKELLSSHGCGEAFWMGNLKNRDIKGREILSQQPTNHEDESDDEGGSVTNSTSTDRTLGDDPIGQVED